MARLLTLLRDERQMFVAANVAVNLVVLLRSFITMQVLDYTQLGLVALLQSIILLLGALQFGFLNGGFRLACAANADEARHINNLIYTFLAGLTAASSLATLLVLAFVDVGEVDLIAALGVGAGILMLARNWITNQMVAEGALIRLNGINLASALLSLAALALIPWDAYLACVLAVVVQPAAFVLAGWLAEPRLIPSRLELRRPLLKAVLAAGFVVFLTGIFMQIIMQIERWYVTAFLGLDALGHLYLAYLFVTLFQLVPTSLDQLFLPAAVRAHVARDEPRLRRMMRIFFLVQLAYCAVAAAAVAVAAGPVTGWVLPRYVPDLVYVYLVTPGLILFTMSSPFAIAFNVLIRYRTYFIAYGSGLALTALAFLYGALNDGAIGLAGAMLIRSATYGLIAAILVVGFFLATRDSPGFHLRWLPTRRGAA
jgi:O-antigen/teichoic acid export membrane protein